MLASLSPRAILFDADGTLLDSLPPHVQFVRTMNEELGLGLPLPDPSDVVACRKITAAPMGNFFRAAGFPESTIERCVQAYETRFANECPVAPFAGVDSLLERLAANNVPTAVVSSNTEANVRTGLGPELSSRFEFIDGIDNAPADKAEAIGAALRRLGVAQATYVGDTRKDCIKATAAGCTFVGVDYGFEALREGVDGSFEVASSVAELEALLLCAERSTEAELG